FLMRVHDYDSSRLEYSQKFYRPLHISGFNLLPQAGGTAIYYGNTPLHRPRWVAAGILGFDFNTRLQRFYGDTKHVIIPYANYSYITYPTTNPHDHFIFDIEDGWYRLDMVRFGIKQFLYVKDCLGMIERRWSADIWANAFFDTHTIPQKIPKVYGSFVMKSSPTLLHVFQSAWDLEFGMLDHFNYRIEWTFSADLALTVEYRHRDSLDWRKVDHENFILDSFRSIHQLRRSSLSDRRDTLLFHIFYRLHPNWAIEFQSRQGWNRLHERGYSEYEIAFLTTLRSAWNFKLSFRHQEDDDRFAVNFSIGLRRPDLEKCLIPCLDF
ncbi:MAG: hypothetical protein LLG04_07525, partial [Parachlamydia sp.]|nr:hypothetical protein [Parachlamydia sp.]